MSKNKDRKLPVKKRSLRALTEKDARGVRGGGKGPPPVEGSFRLTSAP